MASSILINGGHGLLNPSPASLRVASIPSFDPIAISKVAWSSASAGPLVSPCGCLRRRGCGRHLRLSARWPQSRGSSSCTLTPLHWMHWMGEGSRRPGDGRATNVEIFHRRDADDGGGINGVLGVRDGGDVVKRFSIRARCSQCPAGWASSCHSAPTGTA